MIIVNLKGGLGNYLFQVAVGYSLSLDNNINYTIDTSRIMQVHSNWSMYLNNIFRNIPVNTNLPIHSIYSYESLTYKPIKYSENMLLDGYYQSDKYWVGNEDKIRDLFSIDDETLKYLNDKYLDIIQSEETCSIHVRRGDFLGIDFYNKLGIDYYTKAINEVGIDKHFIIF
jgi:hypothetical protein